METSSSGELSPPAQRSFAIMSEAVSGLEPALLWKHFAAISSIPRPSKSEAAVARYVIETAQRTGCSVDRDAVGNLLIRKPASPGREGAPSICLQGHLDMVCEKNAETAHDFNKDPIRLQRNGDHIKATGTTLGADNGIAVATSLALMEDERVQHGPLEFLLTIDEETGLTGAKNLDPNLISSRILLNLDSEEEGALYVGCSGGRDTNGSWKLAWEKAPARSHIVRISVKGLKGGHSGLDIDKQRGNAIKIAARAAVLLTARGARVSAFNGGNKRNAIPREAEVTLYLPQVQWDESVQLIERFQEVIQAELQASDPGVKVSIATVKTRRGKVWARALQNKILATVAAMPHGVTKMSADIPGLVQTSSNLGVIRSTKNEVVMSTSQRSSVASEMADVAYSAAACLQLGGAKVDAGVGYPGWKPNLESPVLKLAQATFKDLYRRDPAVKAIHAGLECGIIGEKIPGIDMVSFGPTIENAHSPDESVEIASVDHFYKYLLRMLDRLSAAS
jgi:dipeptidase D